MVTGRDIYWRLENIAIAVSSLHYQLLGTENYSVIFPDLFTNSLIFESKWPRPTDQHCRCKSSPGRRVYPLSGGMCVRVELISNNGLIRILLRKVCADKSVNRRWEFFPEFNGKFKPRERREPEQTNDQRQVIPFWWSLSLQTPCGRYGYAINDIAL